MSASMPLDAAAPAGHALTDAQVDSYDRDGFLFPLPVFTATEAAGWAAEIARLPTPELQRRCLFQKDYRGKTLRENLGLKRPAAGAWKVQPRDAAE